MLRLKRLKLAEQGFTLIEVLVAILVTTLFISIAMQAMVFSAVFKVKAQEYAEATTWIQEDLEDVKYQADNLQFLQTTLTANAAAAASSISINAPNTDIINSFATNDTLRVGLDPTNYKITNVSVTGSTRTLTISPNLGKAQAINAVVVATKMCNPTAQNAGLADWLRDNVTDTNHSDGITDITSNDNTYSQTKNSKFTGKPFQISRTTTLSNSTPYSVLRLSYSVAPVNAHTTLSAAASATSTTLNVVSASGFKPGNTLTVGSANVNEIQSISVNTITLKNQLGSDQPSNSIVDVSIATTNTEVIPNVAFQCP
jgi:prepilin-type N-terminal cleavage/methylation domain-containing protein